MEIEGQVVLITGASAGIGAATALLLSRRGARVVVTARREDALSRMVVDIEADGGQATACAADVTQPDDLQRVVAHAVQHFGRLDALVANAGVAAVAPLSDGTLADWNQMVDVNLRGVLHGIAAALPTFSSQGSGHFVTVTSTAATKWVPGQGVYAATKAGVRAALRSAPQGDRAADTFHHDLPRRDPNRVHDRPGSAQADSRNRHAGPTPLPKRSPTRSPSLRA
jgi:NADP-dependent 3-hydroxy acid dehydrogenase YdfG